MKTLAKWVLLTAILLIELSPNLYSQCFESQSLPVLKHYPTVGTPNFIRLYNYGFCVSDSISDTTLWFNFHPEGKRGLIYWGYSSPMGYSLTVNSIKLYDSSCALISIGNDMPLLSDSVYYVSFDIQTIYIDNFCPYFLIINPLAAEFGPVVAQQINKYINVIWTTFSEKNSNEFIIQYSYDLDNWVDAASKKASGNKSTSTTYSTEFIPPYSGIIYIKITEYDYNGGRTFSEIIMTRYFSPNQYKLEHYDLAGRLIYIK
jgi:hypothetical protein